MSICSVCGEMIPLKDGQVHDGKFYCQDCFEDEFTICDICGEVVHQYDSRHIDGYGVVCDTCYEEDFFICNGCDEILHRDDILWGCDDNPYCEDCWCERFTTCYDCGETIWQEDSYYDVDTGYSYCEYCYSRLVPQTIYSYHNSRVEYIPRYLNDEDRNQHFRELYGLELEITGSCSTAKEFKDIIGDNGVLMYDSSVDGYEFVSMPISREYFYKEFIPTMSRGLQYLRDNDCSGHNGGGIHIHFKELKGGLEVANMTQILYGDEADKAIWLKISQRNKYAMNNWCSMNYTEYTPKEIVEWGYKYPNGSGNHGTALNYDYRTETHELRIFNSNLRIERVIKNMECLFALEDYVKQQTELVCTTKGYLQFVLDNADKYKTLVGFLVEKNILDMAERMYSDFRVPSAIKQAEMLLDSIDASDLMASEV